MGLPLMLAAGGLWLSGNWPCVRDDGTRWLCYLYLIEWGLAMGLAFWYLAGLAWGWPAGLVGPAAGVLVAVLVGLTAMLTGSPEVDVLGGVRDVGVGSGLVAVDGIFGYPFELLARRLVLALPIVGLACGGLILVLGIAAIVTATPSDYSAAPIPAVFAPAMLLAGGGTLAVSAWLGLGGRHEIPASIPTADDRDDAGRRTS